MNDPQHLRQDEIIGHTIVSLHSEQNRKEDLDFSADFMCLDSGTVTAVPLACAPFFACILPPMAVRLDSSVIQAITSNPISRILAIQSADGLIDPDSLVIELMSGDCLTSTGVSPHGTGLAGIRLFRRGELDLSGHSDYWKLDFEADGQDLSVGAQHKPNS